MNYVKVHDSEFSLRHSTLRVELQREYVWHDSNDLAIDAISQLLSPFEIY